MQKTKNIRLLIILIALSIITVIAGMYDGADRLDVEKDKFVVHQSNSIDKVVITHNSQTNILTLVDRQWKLNEKYTANLSRINDLFIILDETSVRRKAGKNEQEELKKKLLIEGTKVEYYIKDILLTTYYYGSNDKKSLTYQMKEGEDVYIVNIPGHNYHIASLFELPTDDWRTAYVFASNWTTFDRMEMNYPSNVDRKSFSINYDRNGYFIPNVANLDSAKMYDYLERVSYLQVTEYLSNPLLNEDLNPLASLAIYDVNSNVASIEFYPFDSLEVLGKISEEEWAKFRSSDIQKLMKSPGDFEIAE